MDITWSITKIRQDNDMTNRTCAVYDENDVGDYYQKVLFCRPNYNGFKHL